MHTVIGVFDELLQAQQARAHLLRQFSPRQVHLGAGHLSPEGEVVTEGHGGRQKWENRSVLAALGSFWANLIESHAHSHALDLAMQRGRVVVAVQVDDDTQASQVAQVMDHCHAIEVQHGDAPRVGAPLHKVQPWHADGGTPPDARTSSGAAAGGAPIGTHSLTGAGANVGQPQRPQQEAVEHATANRERSGAADPLRQRPEAGGER